MSKIILDLCGGTGSWSKPYKDAGYDVRLITLPDYDVTDVTFNGNGTLFFHRQSPGTVSESGGMLIYYKDVYGILAAPPCTEFSLAKGSAPRDFEAAMKVVSACLNVIWRCRIDAKPKFWALENPVGFLRQFLGVPAYQFEQWQFGELQIKKTDVWGYFNFPAPTVTSKPTVDMVERFPNGRTNSRAWGKPECPREYAHLNLDRAAVRSITPPGFAQAFYRANK